MIEEDRELVDRCRAGQESAFREFLERFQGMVYGICLRMVGDGHEAEDLAQESLVRALRSIGKWDGLRPLRPWLLTIAANRCRTHLGRRKRQPMTSAYDVEIPAPPTGAEDARELQAEIHRALDALRPDYRRVFLLFHEQGCSYEDMSELIDRPIGTIKTWLHRARAELMVSLRRRGFAPENHDDLSQVRGHSG